MIRERFLSALSLLNRLLTVDGAGSGLDADLLDGVQGENYARTDVATSFASDVSIAGNLTAAGTTHIFGPTATTMGAIKHVANAGTDSFFGIYDTGQARYYGLTVDLPAPAGTSCLGGYWSGLGVGGAANTGSASRIFGVVTANNGVLIDGWANGHIDLGIAGQPSRIFLRDASAAPATPTGGGCIYIESGSLKYKGSSGTITVLGAA